MDSRGTTDESLIDRIQQLEHERDELRKDIEQLCMQRAGPTYLAVATRMHFQRTAGLEQEIENLKNKLAVCTRNHLNLQEELSEVYNIKSQLADLHTMEVSKNREAERQLKFFQGCVAAAFAERDNALMEAEKAKEREDLMSREVNTLRQRVEEMTSTFLEEKELHASLKIDLMKLKEKNESFHEVVTKFYGIRQSFSGLSDGMSIDDKCECLLQDAPKMWSFNSDMKNPTSEYIIALEKELETLRNTVARQQNKMRMGLEIEDHLKKRVRKLEKDKIHFDDIIKSKLSKLHNFHTQHRCEVVDLLEHEKTQFKIMLDLLHERIKLLPKNQKHEFGSQQGDTETVEIECRDVHTTTDTESSMGHEKMAPASSIITPEGTNDTSEALARALEEKEKELESPTFVSDGTSDTSNVLAQALREKVAALLLLSQQDEMHLLERNVNAARQRKMEELQRNLLQVTNEKVKALMELAQLRQDYQQLQESISRGIKRGTLPAETCDKAIGDIEKGGKLKNMLKKTYLSRWINIPDLGVDAHMNNEGNPDNKRFSYPDFARLKIENATFKESIESMEHLTSSVHRLRQLLIKAKNSSASPSSSTSTITVLDDIITEARLVKTALGSSLPVSWSGEAESAVFPETALHEAADGCGDPSREKLDFVSAAGFEMMELLILAAQVLEEEITGPAPRDES